MPLVKLHTKEELTDTEQPAVKVRTHRKNKPFARNDIDASRMLKGIFHIASVISDFDLRLYFWGNKINKSSDNLSSMSKDIAASSEEISASISHIAAANTDMFEAISSISDDAKKLSENSEKSTEVLRAIRDENAEMLSTSGDMENSVNALLDVIKKINDAIKGISKISDQTKLLSFNASIESARAGAAGKGFAVVSGEIRKLSDTTKDMTARINRLLIDMDRASKLSKSSVEKTLQSISTVSGKVDTISDVMSESTNATKSITDRIANVTHTSSKINDSLQELSAASENVSNDMQHLSGSADELKYISKSLKDLSVSLGDMEDKVEGLANYAGEIVTSQLCGFSNDDFIETIQNAIDAHRGWVTRLAEMAEAMEVRPIQTNEHKCGFGHFYYAVMPSNYNIEKIWREIEEIHHNLHKTGDFVIECIKKNDYECAQESVKTAEKMSGLIISRFNQIIEYATNMKAVGENVF